MYILNAEFVLVINALITVNEFNMIVRRYQKKHSVLWGFDPDIAWALRSECLPVCTALWSRAEHACSILRLPSAVNVQGLCSDVTTVSKLHDRRRHFTAMKSMYSLSF